VVAVVWGIFVLEVFLVVIAGRGRENSGTNQCGEVGNGLPYLKEEVVVVVKLGWRKALRRVVITASE
jgi:hypothetical protein